MFMTSSPHRQRYMSCLEKVHVCCVHVCWICYPLLCIDQFFLLSENIDPLLGSLTALECALDGYHKLSQMAEDIFGSQMVCSGKQKQKEYNTGEEIAFSNSLQFIKLKRRKA